jgi:hypothetical protein
MPAEAASYLIRQFETAWKLAAFHLDGLTTEECLWRPSSRGLHIDQALDGTWRAQMPVRESYDIGPPSIAWITWHIGSWWSMVLDHSFGRGQLSQMDVRWPGTAEATQQWIVALHGEWQQVLNRLMDDDLASCEGTRWPFKGRPFGDVVAWVNVELTKNAAEIGYARFLYATKVGTSL